MTPLAGSNPPLFVDPLFRPLAGSSCLINNIEAGEDKAIQSIKALGNTRDLGMFQPEIQTGIVVLNLPQSAIDHKAEILNGQEEP
jgi:hypothetical protein